MLFLVNLNFKKISYRSGLGGFQTFNKVFFWFFRFLLNDRTPSKDNVGMVPRGDTQALMCSIYDFFPNELTVKWKKNEIEETGFTTWPPKSFRNTFSAVSVLNVKNTDWDSKAVYTCEVTHKGKLYMKKASKGTTCGPQPPLSYSSS
uniref:Ig-like domain-containing protein n=1 Tax=Labrus bergylta TaxID=56723 RepID=A0A3Q3GAU3_9LABR